MDSITNWISDKVLMASLSTIHNYSSELLSDKIEKYYNDHSIMHSERIIKIIRLLLEKNDKDDYLSDLEKYILISSAFLHDIGMQNEKASEDSDTRRDIHHKLSSDMIKSKWNEIGISEDLVDIVALISEGHRGVIDERFNNKTIRTCEVIRCELLGALLYLGDELDISYQRVSPIKFDYLKIPTESAIHFFKNYYTQGINIGDDRCVEISFRYPPGRKDQYHLIFGKIVLDKIDKVINDLIPILGDKHKIFMIFNESNFTIDENSSIRDVSPRLYEQIVFKIRGLESLYLLKKLKFEEMIGDINAELFYKGNVRWADIVNGLEIERSQFSFIYSKLKLLFTESCSKQSITGLLICGEGGSGKTTLLMSLSFKVFNDKYYDKVNLVVLPDDKEFKWSELKLLYYTTQNPIILFIDGLNIDFINDTILNTYYEIQDSSIPVVLVFAARLNEWKNSKGDLLKTKFSKFESEQLDVLNDTEIRSLLKKLEEHNQLYKLALLSPLERFNRLREVSQRQLLVAMLEATQGKHFPEIVIDEYEKIRNKYFEAAKAYEIMCLFYIYDVLIPQELLFKMLFCIDYDDFETRVLQHTYLIIVKHPNIDYGVYYRPRHKEIAKILIDNISDYATNIKQLRVVTSVLNIIDPDNKPQRYVIINFLKNYINQVIKTKPKNDYPDRFEELKQFIIKSSQNIHKLFSECLS